MNREPGYYWVRLGRKWMVARYDPKLGGDGPWLLVYDDDDKTYQHEDDELNQIDERRIERPEQGPNT